MTRRRHERIFLARPRPECAPPGRTPEVHAYRVPDSCTSPGDVAATAWEAACGDRITPSEAEIVPFLMGNPCPRCLVLAVLASDAPPPTWPEGEGALPGPRPEIDGTPVVESATVDLAYAVSWRARELHLVENNAPEVQLDGRRLVIGLCAGLGWGPSADSPNGWPVCGDCLAIADHRKPTT